MNRPMTILVVLALFGLFFFIWVRYLLYLRGKKPTNVEKYNHDYDSRAYHDTYANTQQSLLEAVLRTIINIELDSRKWNYSIEKKKRLARSALKIYRKRIPNFSSLINNLIYELEAFIILHPHKPLVEFANQILESHADTMCDSDELLERYLDSDE